MASTKSEYERSIAIISSMEERTLALEKAIGMLGKALMEDDGSLISEWEARVRDLEKEIRVLQETETREEDG